MPSIDVPLERGRFGQTSRRDSWWVQPLVVFLGLSAFLVYSTWAAFQGDHYRFGPYLSPFYSPELLGDATSYLIPQLKVKVEFYEGKPMSVELPATVDMTVVETEPGMKGASVSNVTKPAKMETGLVVQVPPFITEGEKIRVNTAEGTYQ